MSVNRIVARTRSGSDPRATAHVDRSCQELADRGDDWFGIAGPGCRVAGTEVEKARAGNLIGDI
jgi:hypothetical protein